MSQLPPAKINQQSLSISHQSLHANQKSKDGRNSQYLNMPSKHSMPVSMVDSRASSINQGEIPIALTNVVSQKQDIRGRPMSNTAASTHNVGATSSQHSYANS